MFVSPLRLAVIITALATTACAGQSGSMPVAPVQSNSAFVPQNTPDTSDASAPTAYAPNAYRSCGDPAPGEAACFAVVRTDADGGKLAGFHGQFRTTDTLSRDAVAGSPSGYGPSALIAAYHLPTGGGVGQTVAIVDAYDDPKAEADLGVYRAQFGLPACTTANHCFRKVGQAGSSSAKLLPKANASWSQEISLDLDIVSAVCPNCHILLVEASSASVANLAASVNTAARLGATEISNSYGNREATASSSAYTHPGIVITASTNDTGTGAMQPATFSSVVAVGGTSLQSASNDRGWNETAWGSGGSGCSAYVAKPVWQTDAGCTMRAEADVSFVADPNTGVATYDSVPYAGSSGWLVVGGTSVGAPAIAAAYALAGNASSQNAAQGIYSNSGGLNDITSGSNGSCSASYQYICNAGPGYDGPTGRGTPNGVGAF